MVGDVAASGTRIAISLNRFKWNKSSNGGDAAASAEDDRKRIRLYGRLS